MQFNGDLKLDHKKITNRTMMDWIVWKYRISLKTEKSRLYLTESVDDK